MSFFLPLLLIFIAFSYVGISALSIKKRNWSLNSPAAIFSAIFGVIYFAIPAWQMISSEFRISEQYSPWSFFVGTIYLLTYWFVAIITFRILRKKNIFPGERKSLGRKGLLITTGVLLVPGAIGSAYLYTILPGIGESEFMANRITLMRGLGWWLMLTYLLYGYSAILAIHILAQRKIFALKNTIIIALLISSLFVSYRIYYLLGSRQTMMYPILTVLIVASSIGLLNIRRAAIAGTITTVAFVAMLYFGGTRMHEDKLSIDVNYTQQVSNALGNGELVVWAIENRQAYDIAGGETIAAAITSFVPRTLMPDKPLGGGPILMNMIYPGSYGLHLDNISSITTGLPVEGLINFGLPGCVVVGILHGLLLTFLARSWPQLSNDPIGQTLYGILFMGICFAVLTNELLGAFMRTAFVAGFLWLTQILTYSSAWRK